MIAKQAVLDYAGCECVVDVSEPSDLEWLLEFLEPDFDRRDEDAPRTHEGTDRTHEGTKQNARRVAMRRDGQLFDELNSRGPHRSGEAIPCFALDGRFESLQRWTAADNDPDTLLVFDERAGTFTRRARSDTFVELIAQPGRSPARISLLRAVRELTSASVVDRGAVVLHGAALAWRGRGIVIAGPKEAGKTTLLLHLLSTMTGAQLLANDRVTIRTAGETLQVRGMPTIAHVRGGSLAWVPHLAERFRACRDHHRLTLAEADRRSEARECARTSMGASDRTSWSLSPAQLARLVGVRRSPEVPLVAVLFPRKTNRPGGLSLEPLLRDEAERCVKDAVFTSGPPPSLATFFGSPSAHGPESLVLLHMLPPTIPCFECTLGTDAYTDPDAWRPLAGLPTMPKAREASAERSWRAAEATRSRARADR